MNPPCGPVAEGSEGGPQQGEKDRSGGGPPAPSEGFFNGVLSAPDDGAAPAPSIDASPAMGAGIPAAEPAAPSPLPQVSSASVPLNELPGLARSTDAAAEKPPAAVPLPDPSLSSPAIDGARRATRSSTRSAVTDAAAQRHQHQQPQRKARRRWSPELHREFVSALQRLGGAQAATPKKIRKLMKVDGLTIGEVKSHLQKYRLHTWRASSDSGDEGQAATALSSGSEQQHSTSQSGSPQGSLQGTVSSRTVSVTAGDSCDVDDEDEDGKSESYSWEMHQRGTKSSSS